MKLNKRKKGSFVGLAGCFGMLGLLAVAMLCPMQGNSASADEGDVTQDARTNATVFVKSVVSVSLQSSVDVDVIPKSKLGTSSSTAKLTVSTNNTSGYKILMSTNGSNALTSTDSTVTATIPAVEGTKTLANFGKTGWGYNLSDENVPVDANTQFSAVPATTTQVKNAPTERVSDTYNLTFGAAVDTSLPAGAYSNSVTISVVANPLTLTNLQQLTYMQDMTPDICKQTTAVHTTKQLIDTRDGNMYYVTKMKDGNCWMTQNLDLDITTAGLKMADTDLTHDWTKEYTGNGIRIGTAEDPTIVKVTDKDGTTTDVSVPSNGAQSADEYVPTNTQTEVPAAVSSPSQVTTYSWDFGKWVLATPTLGKSCGDVKDISECTFVGFVDVSGPEWKPTFQARTLAAGEEFDLPTGVGKGTDGADVTYKVEAGQTIAVDSAAKTYDPHYLIGNYYQFNAATAGSGGAIADANAEASICPKGWHLPTSGTQNNDANDSFYNLLVKYGLQSSVQGNADGVNYNIATTPLYFVRSGYINLNNGWARYIGRHGFYISSVATVGTTEAGEKSLTAQVLHFIMNIDLPNDGSRFRGFPLRCLAYTE